MSSISTATTTTNNIFLPRLLLTRTVDVAATVVLIGPGRHHQFRRLLIELAGSCWLLFCWLNGSLLTIATAAATTWTAVMAGRAQMLLDS